MNLVKWKNTRDISILVAFLYTYQKGKLRKQFHLQLHQKIHRNNFNQGVKRPILRKLQDTEEKS